MSGARIRSERSYRFPLGRAELWQTLRRVEDYSTWWPWVRQLDGAALEAGRIWRSTIQPPLPYALRCSLRLDSVVEPELIEAELTGDLTGWARIELHESVDGAAGDVTEVHLVTDLAASSPPIRLASRTFPALARWGHDWVLDTAARQFLAAVVPDRR